MQMLPGLILQAAQNQAFQRVHRQRFVDNLLQQGRITTMQRPGVPVQTQQTAVVVFADQLREQWQLVARHAPINKALRQCIKLEPSDTQPTGQGLGPL